MLSKEASIQGNMIYFLLPVSNIGVGIDECYIQVNTQGNSFGHCGFDDVNYIPCKERSVALLCVLTTELHSMA